MDRGNAYMGNPGMQPDIHRPPMHPGGMPPMPPHGMPPQGYPGGQPEGGQQQVPPSNANSRTVFVGNIPYDAEDSQLKAILKLAGPFNTFRLKHDKETEKPKGYGF